MMLMMGKYEMLRKGYVSVAARLEIWAKASVEQGKGTERQQGYVG